MSEHFNDENHYIGTFNILGDEIEGEIIHNKKTGVIILDLAKRLDEKTFMGKSYANMPVISGRINSGAIVTLFNNKCINNHTNVGQMQRICFRCDYLIWAARLEEDAQYNEFVCILKNAFVWTQLSVYETADMGIKMKEKSDEREFSWFGVKVIFTVFTNETFCVPFESEEKTIVQRVKLTIASDIKRTIDEFISIRDKVVAMISFAIKNNINIDEEYFLDYEDSYLVGEEFKQYHKHYLLCAKRELQVYESKIWDYNFTMNQLSFDKDIDKELEKLAPILNLYSSLFKYRDMPVEMIFLNIVQALETFHSRFFYGDKKNKYIESVMERFSGAIIYEQVEKKLLSDAQKKCNHIILASRLNDLLIGNYNTIFFAYWGCDEDYGHIIADTRHYYTHYNISKEEKALAGDDLKDAIFILSSLLEYHICLILGIDIEEKVRQSLSTHDARKQLEKFQIKETENNNPKCSTQAEEVC